MPVPAAAHPNTARVASPDGRLALAVSTAGGNLSYSVTRAGRTLIAPSALNGIWALDFMHDTLYGGRCFRTLNVIDEANREALAIEAGTSIPAARVVRTLEQLIEDLRTTSRDPL